MSMTNYCMHCGDVLACKRNTKKYCSDRCKQAAFYLRMAQSSASHPPLNHNRGEPLPFTVKSLPLAGYKYSGGQIAGEDKKQLAQAKGNKKEVFRHSALIDDIGYAVNADEKTLMMVQFPNKYWHTPDLEKVKWVSLRLRSVIENLLRLDRIVVEYRSLVLLSEAMASLANSTKYKCLPPNYPFREQIRQWQKILKRIARDKDGVVRFKLTLEHKAQLMITRFQLADLVPFAKFATLDFSK